jgi:hypothetical protein
MIKKLSLRYLYCLLLCNNFPKVCNFWKVVCFVVVTTATQRTQRVDLKPFVSFALAESNSLCPLFLN